MWSKLRIESQSDVCTASNSSNEMQYAGGSYDFPESSVKQFPQKCQLAGSLWRINAKFPVPKRVLSHGVNSHAENN